MNDNWIKKKNKLITKLADALKGPNYIHYESRLTLIQRVREATK
jgi:hypothetical protein